jgi:hypothetical protein
VTKNCFPLHKTKETVNDLDFQDEGKGGGHPPHADRAQCVVPSVCPVEFPYLPVPTLLTITCTQVLWFLPRWPVSCLLLSDHCMFYPHNQVYVSLGRLDPSVFEFSNSLYRHPSMCILCSSRFTSYNQQTKKDTGALLTPTKKMFSTFLDLSRGPKKRRKSSVSSKCCVKGRKEGKTKKDSKKDRS